MTLAVLRPPATDDLVFWALQVGFSEGDRRTGAAHVGLQWHVSHPDARAVNWGGYHEGGGLLEGTDSELSSATDNPNTRDFPWQPGVEYGLTIEPGTRTGWWRASVLDRSSGRSQVIRELHGGGDRLTAPVVWSEVFAACDAPGVTVRWANPQLERFEGGVWEPEGYRVTYQTVAAGGCSNTDVTPDGNGVLQHTATRRRTRTGAVVRTR